MFWCIATIILGILVIGIHVHTFIKRKSLGLDRRIKYSVVRLCMMTLACLLHVIAIPVGAYGSQWGIAVVSLGLCFLWQFVEAGILTVLVNTKIIKEKYERAD